MELEMYEDEHEWACIDEGVVGRLVGYYCLQDNFSRSRNC